MAERQARGDDDLRGIQLFIEGGGRGKNAALPLRKGFGAFLAELREAARARGLRWDIFLSGPRAEALKDFQRACRLEPDRINVLLVDSESQVRTSPREHLRQGGQWRVDQPEEHVHLMVQAMEAWIVADPAAVGQFYGQAFQASALPGAPDVETIPKDRLMDGLTQASRGTQKGSYHKIRHAGPLLERIDPALVRSKAKHCERLFATLLGIIEAQA